MITRTHSLAGTILLLGLVFVSGCGSKKIERSETSSGPGAKAPSGLVKIGGTVTIDGQPKPGVMVLLCPPTEEQQAPMQNRPFMKVGAGAFTDKDGKWQYTTFSANDGIAPGQYLVVFHWLPIFDPENRDDRQELESVLDWQEDLTEAATKAPNFDPKMAPFYKKYRGNGAGMMKINVEQGKPQTDLKWDLTSE